RAEGPPSSVRHSRAPARAAAPGSLDVVAYRAQKAVDAELLEDHGRVAVGVEHDQLGLLLALDPHAALGLAAAEHEPQIAGFRREHLARRVRRDIRQRQLLHRALLA